MGMIQKSQTAKSTPFDPTGSTLLSTDTEAAIKEIASAIASGILNYNLTANTAFTTSSTTFVLITGFTLTPASGTYAIIYNSSILYTTTPRFHRWSIFRAGVELTDSRREQLTSRANQNMVDSTIAIATFNGSQTCDVRVLCDTSGGSLTVNARSILLIRLGP
jgi:hypothetical protein